MSGWFETVLRRQMIVHTVAGQSFDGLLTETAPGGIVVHASLLGEKGKPVPLVGGTFIPRDQILFVQLVD